MALKYAFDREFSLIEVSTKADDSEGVRAHIWYFDLWLVLIVCLLVFLRSILLIGVVPLPSKLHGILSDLEVQCNPLLFAWVPGHHYLSSHAKLGDMLCSDKEAVTQVDSFVNTSLVHLQKLVQSSNIQVCQSELEDDSRSRGR